LEGDDIFLLTSLETASFGLINYFNIKISMPGTFSILIIEPEVCGDSGQESCSVWFNANKNFDLKSVRVLNNWTYTAEKVSTNPYRFSRSSDFIFESHHLIAYQGASIGRHKLTNYEKKSLGYKADYRYRSGKVFLMDTAFGIQVFFYRIPFYYYCSIEKVFSRNEIVYPIVSIPEFNISTQAKFSIGFMPSLTLKCSYSGLYSLNDNITCNFIGLAFSPTSVSIRIVGDFPDSNSTKSTDETFEFYGNTSVSGIANIGNDPVEFDGTYSEEKKYLLFNMGFDSNPITGFEFHIASLTQSKRKISIWVKQLILLRVSLYIC